MPSSSFYTDGETYDTAVVTSNDNPASTTPSQAPSSFYPEGTVYNTLADSDELTAQFLDDLQQAANSVTQAAQQAINAAASAGISLQDETAAANSAQAAKTSETNAKTSETNAAASEASAASHDTDAQTQATNAATSAAAALASQNAAATSESNAAGSSTSAGVQAQAAAASAVNASTSETNAYTSETNAAASASAAAGSEATVAASASAAATSESNAKTSETNAASSASSASTSASHAATSETNAGNSATSASTSATTATTQAGIATTAATNAAASFNQFQGIYYGAAAADPATDPLGSTPGAGDFYFNTTASKFRSFDGSQWGDMVAGGTQTRFIFSATSGQTVFSGADTFSKTLAYTAGSVEVIVNGFWLPYSDYTATDGSTITLNASANAGDVIYVFALSKFSIADALAKTANGSDILSPATFRTNLGLKSAAVADITGTVSQSAGVPTGAIIESGSNANGRYTKYADGTMICWQAGLSIGAATDSAANIWAGHGGLTWTFPVAFTTIPAVSASLDNTGSWLAVGGNSLSNASLQTWSYIQRAGTNTASVMAIGRWY